MRVGSVCVKTPGLVGCQFVRMVCLNDDCGLLQNQSVCSLWINTGNSQNEHPGCGTVAHSYHPWVARKCWWWLGLRTVGRLSTTLPQIRVGFAPMYSHWRTEYGGQQQKTSVVSNTDDGNALKEDLLLFLIAHLIMKNEAPKQNTKEEIRTKCYIALERKEKKKKGHPW